MIHSRCHWAGVARLMPLQCSLQYHCGEQRLCFQRYLTLISDFCSSLRLYNIDERCFVVRSQNLPKYQRTKVIIILHPKMCKIARNFGATFPIFCATSARDLAQLLDFLSATFWGDYLMVLHNRAMGRHLPHGITQCYLLPNTTERTPP